MDDETQIVTDFNLTEASSEKIKRSIAEYLNEAGKSEQSLILMYAIRKLEAESLRATGTQVAQHLGYMCDDDVRHVQPYERDEKGYLYYRLTEKGRRAYFGTVIEKSKVFWEKHWVAVLTLVLTVLLGADRIAAFAEGLVKPVLP